MVKAQLHDRETKQLVMNLGNHSVKVREQGEKVIRFIMWSKDIVAQAVTAQPYAALAWSAVSILLPVSPHIGGFVLQSTHRSYHS